MPKPAPSRVFRMVATADLHIGSRYALVPPHFRPKNAGPAGVFMEYMWACWQHFIRNLPHADCAVINGDACEGEHPTQRSAPDAIEVDPKRQVDMAVETLGPLRDKVDRIWLVRGTTFHEGKWNEQIERLGRELKAEQPTEDRYSTEVLEGTFAGKTWNVVHAQTTGAIYPGTLMNRTTWFATMATALAKTIPADIIIRSHTHSTGKGEFFGKWILSTRAWKLCNPHAISKMEYYRAQALLDLGAHLITIGPDGICWKDFPYETFKPSELRRLA